MAAYCSDAGCCCCQAPCPATVARSLDPLPAPSAKCQRRSMYTCTAAFRCLLSVPALTLCPAMAGSYSYVAAGSCARTYEELAKPVRRRLLFAGEHTCKVYSLGLFGRMRAPEWQPRPHESECKAGVRGVLSYSEATDASKPLGRG